MVVRKRRRILKRNVFGFGGSLTSSNMGRIVTSLFLAFVLAISPLPVDAVAGIAFADGDTGAPATVAYVAGGIRRYSRSRDIHMRDCG